MDSDYFYYEHEHLWTPRFGATLLAASGTALHGGAGIFRGLSPLLLQICDGQKMPKGRTDADAISRRKVMREALATVKISRLCRARINEAGEVGVYSWLEALCQGPWLSVLNLGRERFYPEMEDDF